MAVEKPTMNIVFVDMYDSSANNAVIECIARDTPILINPLPAVVEYLGEDYPFYFNDLDEAAEKINDHDLIEETYKYLNNMNKDFLTQEYFLRSFVESEIYKGI